MSNTVRKTSKQLRDLHLLANLYGAEVEYDNAMGTRCHASPQSLIHVLRLLGASINTMADAPLALQEYYQTTWGRMIEPVTLIWDGEPANVRLRIPAARRGSLEAQLKLEDGAIHSFCAELQDLPVLQSETVTGVTYHTLELPLTCALPPGYHELTVGLSEEVNRTLLIVAPRRAYDPDGGRRRKVWGAFLPLYALHSARSWGAGNFSDLAQLAKWVGSAGGKVVGTLPLLAAFLDEPFEPSPYSPASRLFWNEFYIDIESIPELQTCETAQAILSSQDFACELADLRAARLVDYRRQMALKRRVLGELSKHLLDGNTSRRNIFEKFQQSRPEVQDYARFRAVGERYRQPWSCWPQAIRDGVIQHDNFADTDYQYHLYVQWVAEEQLRDVAKSLHNSEVSLYLDLPLGVNADSYDVWRERTAFALGASGGCPPDVVFPNGQNWGFPPMHPQGIREQGYRYVIAYLRHQLKYAGILRIDHIPAFHRLYWIPHGMESSEGVYVRYSSEELYAVFSLESHRHQALLVGEDLGTLPPEVPTSMVEHHVHRMYVGQYALQPDPTNALPEAPYSSVASLNTHDMPPFAAFLKGDDILLRQTLGLLGNLDPEKEIEQRVAVVQALALFLEATGRLVKELDPAQMTRVFLDYLAANQSRTVLINLEDLWLECEPQNVPGTSDQFPNWRRKAKYSLEEFSVRLKNDKVFDLFCRSTATGILTK